MTMLKLLIIYLIIGIAIQMYINQQRDEYYLKGFTEYERQILEKNVDWFINHSEIKYGN